MKFFLVTFDQLNLAHDSVDLAHLLTTGNLKGIQCVSPTMI